MQIPSIGSIYCHYQVHAWYHRTGNIEYTRGIKDNVFRLIRSDPDAWTEEIPWRWRLHRRERNRANTLLITAQAKNLGNRR